MLMPKKNLLLPKMLRLIRGQLPPAFYVYANVLSINL